MTCGTIGQGLQVRYRHKAIEAMYGGRKCSGTFDQQRVCFHKNMANLEEMVHKGEAKKEDAIYFCPGKACDEK